MNKKVNTLKVTQSELSEIQAHCKNIKSTWRSSLALSDNPILILWSILINSLAKYWHFHIQYTDIIFAQYSQWVRLSCPFVIQLSATNLFVHLSTYFHNNLISFHHFPWTFNPLRKDTEVGITLYDSIVRR